ncbi:MAG: TonB family protein [Gemmatimonadaceae bacterium]
MMRSLVPALCVALLAGCQDSDGARTAAARVLNRTPQPDELPRMTNAQPPFQYPVALYPRKVQGNVTLRLFIDSLGAARPESTRVAESSGEIALDSAAVVGARALTFVPARRRGAPMAVSVLFPVLFRHPEAAPLPGDTAIAALRAAPPLDTVALRRAAAARADSLRLDSLRRDSLRRDSLRRDSVRADSVRADSVRADSVRRAAPRRSAPARSRPRP